ncbi:hypothetical protein PIB30_103350 [Stylosanthes scabra]|uniref:Uncharacterized protein n=1 Tax=Stylosanthes scabra TaxID=79078 RepID=A0ABU6QZJ7_9FABA|nr:hypothetical protein [Stylosanthes scabra]
MRHSLWATGLLPDNTDSLWLEKFGSIPGMSAAVHGNKSTFLLRKWVSPAFTSSGTFFAIIVTSSAFEPICTLSSSPSGCGLFGIFLPGGSRSTRWISAAVSSFTDLVNCSLESCSVMPWHALFCSRDVPFEYAHFTAVDDELHGEDRCGDDGSDLVQGGPSDNCVVRGVVVHD